MPCKADVLYPSKARRFMSEVGAVRRYHRAPLRAAAAACGGLLWVAMGRGWTCNPDRVAVALLARACADRGTP